MKFDQVPVPVSEDAEKKPITLEGVAKEVWKKAGTDEASKVEGIEGFNFKYHEAAIQKISSWEKLKNVGKSAVEGLALAGFSTYLATIAQNGFDSPASAIAIGSVGVLGAGALMRFRNERRGKKTEKKEADSLRSMREKIAQSN